MLYWDKEEDDLDVKHEIDELSSVFQDTYNFHVTHKTIKKREKKRAQTQINAIVASWVDEYDGLKTLLVVYFAGHGKAGDQIGELIINGHKESPSDVRRYLNKVVWNITESCLHEIQSDVLQIFDCCYAGALGTRGTSSQSFEYLAATGAEDTTDSPGDTSFTAALIWALKRLVRESWVRFTTTDLLTEILKAPNFPEDQKPVLSKRRENPTNERIMLHPLRPESPIDGTSSRGPRHKRLQQDVVTLKFVFESRPSVEDIHKLGSDLNHVVRNNELHVNRIAWGGIQPREDIVYRVVSNWKALHTEWQFKRRDEIKVPTDKTAALATQFVKNLQEHVEEQVHEQVKEEVHEQLHEEIQQAAIKRLEKSNTSASLSLMLEE